jgi:glycosyltransferase involved in cell wall biosynthesis
MHVLCLIDSLHPGGGAEESLAALAPRFVQMGMTLDVAYLRERAGLQPQFARAGAAVYSLAGWGGRLGWTRRARQLIRLRRPDLVHTTLFESDVVGRVAARTCGVPVVSSLVSVAYGPEQIAAPGLSLWRVRAAQVLDATTARLVSRFHALSHYVASVMAGRLRIPAERIDVVPRARDPMALGERTAGRRAAARTRLGVTDDQRVVLAAARHEYPKGLDVLVESFPLVLRRMPAARLFIAGREGNRTEAIRGAIDRFGLHDTVHLLGPRPDVLDLLCAADAFAMPSRWEGFGSVLVEAMALEAPIVASDIPAIREVVTDGETACLVPKEDTTALSNAIVESLADPQEASARAHRARARFLEHFTIDRVAAQMMTFYDRALGARPTS